MTADERLLQSYLESGTEEAFSRLVARHINLVYSVAVRVLAGDTHLANDVVQTVFIDLSRKAATLPKRVILAGWLCRHTFFVASTRVRSEQRRRKYEKEAAEMNAGNANEPDWEQLSAVLDQALQTLGAADRDAIVLRYLEGCDWKSVGAALHIKEDTAQKRVSRALDKLRSTLSKCGVMFGVAGLATVMSSHAVGAAPAGMAAKVASMAFAGTAGGGGSVIAWMKFLAGVKTTLKSKIMIACATAFLVAAIAVSWLKNYIPPGAIRLPIGANNQRVTRSARIEAGTESAINGRFRWHWSQVESTDYRKYIAKLRAIGCPEQTIRDIIIADLNQVYGARAEAIWSQKEYWKKDQPAWWYVMYYPDPANTSKMTPEQIEKLKALGEEKKAVIKELLGVNIGFPETSTMIQLGGPPRAISFWFLPEDKRQAALDALEEAGLNRPVQDIRNYDQTRAYHERVKALANVLTPDELEQYRLHNSPKAIKLNNNLAFLNCTPEEFKTLLDLRETATGPDGKNREIELQQAREVLGEERGRKYERVTDRDGGYGNMRNAASLARVPDDIADQIGEIVYDAHAAILLLAKNSDISIDERNAQAQALKSKAETQVNLLLDGHPKRGILFELGRALDHSTSLMQLR